MAAVAPQILVLPQEIKSGQSGEEAEWAGKDEGRNGKVGHTGIWRGNESGRNVAAGGKFAAGRLIAEHAIREAGKGRAGSIEKCDKEEREHEGARGNAQNGLVKGLKVLARLAGRKEVKGFGDKRRDGDDRKCDNAKGSGYEQRGAVKVEIRGGRRDHDEGRKNEKEGRNFGGVKGVIVAGGFRGGKDHDERHEGEKDCNKGGLVKGVDVTGKVKRFIVPGGLKGAVVHGGLKRVVIAGGVRGGNDRKGKLEEVNKWNNARNSKSVIVVREVRGGKGDRFDHQDKKENREEKERKEGKECKNENKEKWAVNKDTSGVNQNGSIAVIVGDSVPVSEKPVEQKL